MISKSNNISYHDGTSAFFFKSVSTHQRDLQIVATEIF